MHDRYVIAAERVPGFPTTVEEVPELLYLFLLERYGTRIAAIREQLSAELSTTACIATTEKHTYVNEVR